MLNSASSIVSVVENRNDKKELIKQNIRLDTLKQLSIGYFHSINSIMSVIIGESEIVNEYLDENRSDETAMIEPQLEKIYRSASNLKHILKHLEAINTIGNEDCCREVEVNKFVRNLPELCSGFQRLIRDTKNIQITILPEVNNSQKKVWHYSILFDYVLPLILQIIKEAICSGDITVKTDSDSDEIVVKFDNSLLSQPENSNLIQHFYSDAALVTDHYENNLVYISHKDSKDGKFSISIKQSSKTNNVKVF